MKLVSALVGLAALGGVALSTAAASAMPVTIPGQASQAPTSNRRLTSATNGGTAGIGRC